MRIFHRFHRSRYLQTLRRSRLVQSAAVSALVLVPTACSSGDSAAFVTDTTVVTSTNADPTSTTTSPAAPATTTTGLTVAFTYAPIAGGKDENPYIAVWIEDANGNLVNTLAAWFLQSPKGQRWLRDLRQWSTISGGTSTTSGATRSPGAYNLTWDGKDISGQSVTAGTYTLYVEAAREKGPYSITSTPFTVGAGQNNVTLPNASELQNLSAVIAS